MPLDISTSDILQGVSGGLLIAASSSLNLLWYGRVTGLSGMLETVATANYARGFDWKAAFLTGLILPAWAARHLVLPAPDAKVAVGGFEFQLFDSPAQIANNVNLLGWIASGLLVGAGTKLANGCTSGHGVCGLPRLSKRSIAAVLTFCATGFVTATALAQGHGTVFTDTPRALLHAGGEDVYMKVTAACLAVSAFVACGGTKFALTAERVTSFGTGLLFGSGLLVSGMCRPSRVKGFLTLTPEQFDPLLMFVLGTVVCVNFATFRFILRRSRPVKAAAFDLPTLKDVDAKLLAGSAMFGVGWGLGGICPGPGMIGFFNYPSPFGVWLASALAGNYLARTFHSDAVGSKLK